MIEIYKDITPEQARKLSQEHTNWKDVCQHHIDLVVPEACKRGKRKAVINLTEFLGDATEDDLEHIRRTLENIGWEVEGFKQLNTRNVDVTIAW